MRNAVFVCIFATGLFISSFLTCHQNKVEHPTPVMEPSSDTEQKVQPISALSTNDGLIAPVIANNSNVILQCENPRFKFIPSQTILKGTTMNNADKVKPEAKSPLIDVYHSLQKESSRLGCCFESVEKDVKRIDVTVSISFRTGKIGNEEVLVSSDKNMNEEIEKCVSQTVGKMAFTAVKVEKDFVYSQKMGFEVGK